DIHWKINNPQLFADVLGFDEIERAAIAIPRLGPHARCPAPVHALFHAAVHRAAHGTTPGSDLLTLSDIDRLVRAISAADLHRFTSLAIDRRMAAVTLDALSSTHEWFGTNFPPDILARLATAAAKQDEPSA